MIGEMLDPRKWVDQYDILAGSVAVLEKQQGTPMASNRVIEVQASNDATDLVKFLICSTEEHQGL
eukprot:gene951-1276_t